MRRFLSCGLLVLVALTGCSGGSATPFINASASANFSLNPSPLELTSSQPAAAVTAQGDTAGVQYTARADASCVNATGAIAVAGDGVAQLDVAGAPLMFIVVAVGAPPSTCTMTVSGSDNSTATIELDYSTITVDASSLVSATLKHATIANGTVTPSTITISKPTDVVMVNASGFTGTTKASVSCPGTAGGVSAIPSNFNGSGSVAIAAYGQGALSGTCTVTFTDATQSTKTLTVTLASAALKKLTVSPSSVQFACAGSSPQTCTTKNVTIAEDGAAKFVINTRPALVAHGSCAASFNGPLKMTTGNGTYASYVAGPQADVSFYGLLTTTSPNCAKIVIGDSVSQTVAVAVNPQVTSGSTVATAPGCTGPDPLAPVPTAPHGMYVWNPYKVQGNYEPLIEQYVLGTTPGKAIDPSICGVSLVVLWSDVESSRGNYYYKTIEDEAAPYVNAGLRVNLLFADASEVVSKTPATPSWVFTQDGVGQINCPGQVAYPNWLDPKFQADWESFIAQMVTEFSAGGASKLVPNIGYMRFGIGAGVEAYPGHIEGPTATSHPCLDAWAQATPAFSYAAWQQYSLNIVNTVVAQQKLHPDKQLMVPLNYVSTYDKANPNDVYVYANAVAAAAAAGGVAFGTENLGISWGKIFPAGANTQPTACNPGAQFTDAYWCQAFNRHLGVVPFEFQPIVSPLNAQGYDVSLPHLLQLAMVNNAQLLELYPQDWVFNDYPAEFPSFTGATQAQYNAAFQAASVILGRNH